MSRILIRSGKDPLVPLSAEASLARNGWGVFGANVGNLLFTSSVHRALSVPGVEVVSNSLLTELPGVNRVYLERINSEFDAFVVPLANAFRPKFVSSLQRLTRAIEQLTIPVTVVGVGVQLPASGKVQDATDEVKAATKAFVSAVLDRSASIGVRGETTRAYLRSLGFPDSSIDVIGCPSLFERGAGLRVTKRAPSLSSESAIAINITPSVRAMAPMIESHVKAYPKMIYVAQEHYELAMLMWGSSSRPKDPRIPTYTGHPLYQQDRVRFFLDSSTWVKALREVDFVFGTRIHGNIAGLMAGTPSLVLTHDSRTLELAEYHSIPYRAVQELPGDVDVRRLYEEASYDKFNANHPLRFEAYRAFLDRNGLKHIFSPGNENPEYDRKLESIDFPPPVRYILANGVLDGEAVVDRLRWLRQGDETDRRRKGGAYHPPFSPASENPRELSDILKRIDAQQEEIQRLSAQLEARDEQVRSLQRELRVLRSLGQRLAELDTTTLGRIVGRVRKRMLSRG